MQLSSVQLYSRRIDSDADLQLEMYEYFDLRA